jgi:hypothetical protein
MATYWIVVRRENEELFDTLSVAFRGRTGFRVIVDRRSRERMRRARDRRGPQMLWGADEFIVAERVDPYL